ncbi:MAG: ATP synthase F1 subunit delta [Clostridia bacterium]|nr:ATP synthase F1 subunit delta [Clostridia bacterium]
MTQTCREYGEALFMLALEENQVNEYSQALKSVEQIVEDTPEYVDFLTSPAIPLMERIAAIDEAFGDSVPEYVLSFIKILCENRVAYLLSGCIEEFEKLVQAASNRTTATVYSVVDLSESQKVALCRKLEKIVGKQIDLDCIKDASLIGGIRIEIDGKIFDGSIKQRLHDVKEVIN